MNMVGSYALKAKNTTSSTKYTGLVRQLLTLALNHADSRTLCLSKLLQHQKCISSSVTNKYYTQPLKVCSSDTNKHEKSLPIIDGEPNFVDDQHVNGNNTSTTAKLDDASDLMIYNTQSRAEANINDDSKTLSGNWMTCIMKFCDEIGLTSKDVPVLLDKIPQLKRVQNLQQLPSIADILLKSGYGKHEDRCLLGFPSILNHINASLEDRSLERWEPKDFKRFGGFKGLRNMQHDNKFQSLNGDLGLENYHSDDRVPSLIVKSVFQDTQWKLCKNKVCRNIKLLEKEGICKRNILDKLYLAKRASTLKLNSAIIEQKKIFGKVNIDELKNYLLNKPDNGMFKALSSLFDCSIKDLRKEEKVYFRGKTIVDAVEVFYFLEDEGFQIGEIRRYIYLLGFNKSCIEQYVTEKKNEGKVPWQDLGHLDANSFSKWSCQYYNERERFLQEMQIALEFS